MKNSPTHNAPGSLEGSPRAREDVALPVNVPRPRTGRKLFVAGIIAARKAQLLHESDVAGYFDLRPDA